MGRPKKADSPRGKRKMKDPNRPKRPTSAYFYFAEQCRNELKKEGKKITRVGDFTKEVSVKWNALSETEKKPFVDKATKDKARYTAQMNAYKGKDADKPKRPQSSYFLFLADFREKMKHAKLEHKEILTKAGEAWKALTPEEKKPYEKRAEVEKKKYEERMREYNKTGGPAKKAKLDVAAATAAANNGRDESEEDEEDDEDEDDDDDYEDDDE